MKNVFLLPVLIICLSLTACVTTAYRLNNVTDKKVTANVMEVTYKGNNLMTPEQTYLYAMRRAAQQTLHHGFKYFKILSNQSFSKTYTWLGPNLIPMTSKEPWTIIKYEFQKHKTSESYSAEKVLIQTKTKEQK